MKAKGTTKEEEIIDIAMGAILFIQALPKEVKIAVVIENSKDKEVQTKSACEFGKHLEIELAKLIKEAE